MNKSAKNEMVVKSNGKKLNGKNALVEVAPVEVVPVEVVPVTPVANSDKPVNTVDFTALYEVITSTPSNKNLLTVRINKCGFYANMRTKNANDFDSVNNDLYYQLVDGTRLFFGSSKNRNGVNIYTNVATVDLLVNNGVCELTDFVPVNDGSYRVRKSSRIKFTVEWFTKFMLVMCNRDAKNILPVD